MEDLHAYTEERSAGEWRGSFSKACKKADGSHPGRSCQKIVEHRKRMVDILLRNILFSINFIVLISLFLLKIYIYRNH